ncbi:MAG TPA: hypothetical protein VEB65_10465, partial [Solirubrobacterales bacterium]|nr:hypothetical protein [Solirubrobacterales bacterium]
MRRTIAAIAAAAAIAVTAAPVANADTVGVDGNGTLVVTSGPEQNRIGLQPSPLEDGRLVIYDSLSGDVTSATPACEQWGADAVMCSWNPRGGVHVDLGDGNDDGYVSFGVPADAAIVFAGGAGDDTLAADVQPTTLDGGPGNDLLNGGDGPDHLVGGEGDDEISGDGGGD